MFEVVAEQFEVIAEEPKNGKGMAGKPIDWDSRLAAVPTMNRWYLIGKTEVRNTLQNIVGKLKRTYDAKVWAFTSRWDKELEDGKVFAMKIS